MFSVIRLSNVYVWVYYPPISIERKDERIETMLKYSIYFPFVRYEFVGLPKNHMYKSSVCAKHIFTQLYNILDL